MGLDGVELIVQVEETFGISLPEQETSRVFTPGQLIDLVCSKLKTTDAQTCRSQRAFYLLRHALKGAWNVPREAVQLDCVFRPWISTVGESDAWKDLSREVFARAWPELERPKALRWSLVMGGAVAACLAFFHLKTAGTFGALLILAGVLFGFPPLAAGLSRPWKNRIPTRYQRVRDLIPLLDASNDIEWDRTQVAERIKTILIEDFGVDPLTYQEGSSLTKDLGLG